MTKDLFDLKGKVALITGGSSGIGFGMADAIAAAGGDIVIWDLNPDTSAVAVEKLKVHGVKVKSYLCDVADRAQIDKSLEATLKDFGRVDGCIASAGIMNPVVDSFFDITPEMWRKVMSINLDGVYHTFQAVLGHMVKRSEAGDPGGRLVALSSLAALMGAAKNEAYTSTKGAVNSLIYALATEFSQYGITANSILPGWISTPINQDALANDPFALTAKKRIPAGRWGEASDFAGLAVYLMSDASSYHTGQLLQIDGGFWRT